MTNQDEVRENWNEKFKWMKNHPQLVSLYEGLPDWWLANFDTILAKKREAVVGLKRKFSQPHDILQNGCGGSDANCDVHPRIEVGDVLDEVLSILS